MPEFIEARVIQKSDTLTNWNNNPLPLYSGEQAFVVDNQGVPYAFKLGAGSPSGQTPGKRFSELPWPDYTVKGSATPSTTWNSSVPAGVYIPLQDGTYGGQTVTLSDGYQVLFWNGSGSPVKVVFPINLGGYATTSQVAEIFSESRILDMGASVPGRYTSMSSQDTNSSYTKTGFVEVDPTWVFNRAGGQSANTVSVMFDEFQSPLGVINYTAGVDFTVHPNTKYVRFSKLGTNPFNDITVKEAVAPKLSAAVQESISGVGVQSASDNYFNWRTAIIPADINASGVVISTSQPRRVTPMMELKDGHSGQIVVANLFSLINPWGMYFYDSTGAFISSVSITGSAASNAALYGDYMSMDVPANAKYMRLRVNFQSGTEQDFQNIKVIDGSAWRVLSTRNVVWSPAINAIDVRNIVRGDRVTKNEVNDKVVLVLGDSISAHLSGAGSWNRWFLSYLNPLQRYSMASGGATLTSDYVGFGPDYLNDGNTFMRQCESAISQINASTMNPPDIVMIMGGTNDFDKTSPNSFVTPAELGSTPYDQYMEQTFMTASPSHNTLVPLTSVTRSKGAGAIRYIVERLGGVLPDTAFIIMTPIQSTLHNQLNAQRLVRDIKWMANRLAIPVIDNWGESNMTMLWDYGTDRKLLADRVHPFVDQSFTPGAPRMGRFIVNEFLQKYIQINNTTTE